MKKKKLAVLFKSLAKEEVKNLKKYLKGTSYTTDCGLYRLFEYLQKYHPSFPDNKLEKSVVNKAVFGKTGDDFKLLHDVSSKLYAVIENFLIQQKLEESYTDKSFLMLKILEERNLDKQFLQKAGALERFWDKEPQAGVEHLYHRFHLAAIKHAHPTHKAEDMLHLDLMIELDKYYIAEKLLLTNNYLHTKNNFNDIAANKDKPIYFIEQVLSCCETPVFKTIPQIGLFLKVYQSIQNIDYSFYQVIKNEFAENIELYDKIEKDDMYFFLQLMCYKLYLQGKDNNGVNILFDFHCFALEYKLVIKDDIIELDMFKNILLTGCAAEKIEWTENFVAEYSGYLPITYQESFVKLSEAILALNKNDFEQALEKVNGVEFVRVIDKLHGRQIILQSYFELESCHEIFLSYTRTFRQFVNGVKGISNLEKENWKNFIFYSRKIFGLKTNIGLDKVLSKKTSLIALLILKENIIKETKINGKAWLTKKVTEQIEIKEAFLNASL